MYGSPLTESDATVLQFFCFIAMIPHMNERKRAAQAGEKFFTGKICKHGHQGLRYTSSGGCVDCTKDRSREDFYAYKMIAVQERRK
jgi:hypothetical protein